MSSLSDHLVRARSLLRQNVTGVVDFNAMAHLQSELSACAEGARAEYESWYFSLSQDERRMQIGSCRELEAILVIERLVSLIQDININVEIYEQVIGSLQGTSLPSDTSHGADS